MDVGLRDKHALFTEPVRDKIVGLEVDEKPSINDPLEIRG